jgi:hypothetical protein
MPPKLQITEDRMLRLMEISISKGLAENETEYLEKIDFPRTNISNVRKGIQRFTRDHIMSACIFTGASADYIYGFTSTIYRKTSKTPIQLLKEAVVSIESELTKKSK